MRRSLATIFLTVTLVFSSLSTFPGTQTLAQRRPRTQKPTSASLASQRGADTISAAQLKDYLSFIASDEMEGRDTPSRGLDTTAKFLAMNLTRWGFKPAGDDGSYLQRITLRRDRVDAAQTRVELNGQTVAVGDDYIPSSVAGNVSSQV